MQNGVPTTCEMNGESSENRFVAVGPLTGCQKYDIHNKVGQIGCSWRTRPWDGHSRSSMAAMGELASLHRHGTKDHFHPGLGPVWVG